MLDVGCWMLDVRCSMFAPVAMTSNEFPSPISVVVSHSRRAYDPPMKISLTVFTLAASLALTSFGAQRGALINVPEASNYELVYSLDIPNNPNFSAGTNYDIDLHSYMPPFSRIAYYRELQPSGGTLNFIGVSMDAFTTDAAQIRV